MIPTLTGISGLQFVAGLKPAAWYRYGIGLTDAGAGACSAWADQSGNGRNLTAAGSARPTIQADRSLLFDGVANVMKASFTLNQPHTVYALFKSVSFTLNDRIFDGVTASARLFQGSSSPSITINAGASINASLAVDTYGAVGCVFNGASSVLQVNNTTVSGDAGTNNPGGITIAALTNASGAFGNIQVKEVIIFSSAHSADTRTRIIRYLSSVGGI